MWYKTYRLRSDLRAAYSLSPNDSLVPYHKVEDWLDRVKTWQPDPLNPNPIVVPEQPKPLSTFELPDAAPQPWWPARSDVPAGNLDETRFQSKILDNERTIWVYTPPGYKLDAEPYSLLVLFDGEAYLDVMNAPNTLDNLLAEERLPPLVAILSHSGSFWWLPADAEEHEWLTSQFVLAEKRPLTIYLDVGLLETEATYRNGPSMLVVNRHLRDELEAKGYTVHYREYAGGHDYLYWRGSFADGLLTLLS